MMDKDKGQTGIKKNFIQYPLYSHAPAWLKALKHCLRLYSSHAGKQQTCEV